MIHGAKRFRGILVFLLEPYPFYRGGGRSCVAGKTKFTLFLLTYPLPQLPSPTHLKRGVGGIFAGLRSIRAGANGGAPEGCV